MHFNVYNKSYSKNKTFSHSAFTINMQDSMLTNMDYNGKTITKDKYYLVLKINITNNSTLKQKLDITNFRLQIDNGYLVPTLDRSDYFIDFGVPYHGEEIKTNTSTTYNLVYELTEDQVASNYKIKILENIEYKVGDLTAHYKILNIRPKKILELENKDIYYLKEEIDLSDSYLGNSTTKINSYEITDNYLYSYEQCSSNSCKTLNDVVSAGYTSSKTKTTLLVLDVDTNLDENSIYSQAIKTMNKFYEDFFTVEYDGKEVTTKNVTPSNLTDKIVLQTSSNISSANNINLLITIRNNVYKVKLK
jgi:hypothetical protein